MLSMYQDELLYIANSKDLISIIKTQKLEILYEELLKGKNGEGPFEKNQLLVRNYSK